MKTSVVNQSAVAGIGGLGSCDSGMGKIVAKPARKVLLFESGFSRDFAVS